MLRPLLLRVTRNMRSQRVDSSIMLAELSALHTVTKDGPMTTSDLACGARLHDHGSDLRILVEPSGLSCSDHVFAGESAEDLFSSDAVLGEVDLRWLGVSLVRRELAEGAMRPGGVVVQQVFGQDLPQVVLIDDQ